MDVRNGYVCDCNGGATGKYCERGEWGGCGEGGRYVCDCNGGATGKYCERGEWERVERFTKNSCTLVLF